MFYVVCNAMSAWKAVDAKTEIAAKAAATRLAAEYGGQAGVIRVGYMPANGELVTIARKGLHFGKKWQRV